MDSHYSWATLPTLADIDGAARRIVRSLRLVAMLHTQAATVAEHLIDQLGNEMAVRKFILVAHTVGAAWPEPVAVCAPCCAVVTHDEQLILRLVEASAADDRPTFDRCVRDLIGETERSSLFAAMRQFVLCYARGRPAPLTP